MMIMNCELLDELMRYADVPRASPLGKGWAKEQGLLS